MRRAVSLIAVLPALALVPLAGASPARAAVATDTTPVQLYWSDISSIYTRTADGTTTKVITAGYHPQITPQGDTIVYQDGPHAPADPYTGGSLYTQQTNALTAANPATALVDASSTTSTTVIHGFDADNSSSVLDVPPTGIGTGTETGTVFHPRGNFVTNGAVYDIETTPVTQSAVRPRVGTTTCELHTVTTDTDYRGLFDDTQTFPEGGTGNGDCDVDPAWTPSNASSTDITSTGDVHAVYSNENPAPNGILQLGENDNQTQTVTAVPSTAGVLSPSYGVIPGDSDTGRAIYSTTSGSGLQTELVDLAVPSATRTATVRDETGRPRVVNSANPGPVPIGGPGSVFDHTAGTPIDSWHFSSDGDSIISATSLGGVRGIWRLDPVDETVAPQLIDGILSPAPVWTSRPTSGATIISSGFPTQLVADGTTHSFLTSIDSSSGNAINMPDVTIDITVPAGVTAQDVTFTALGAPVGLTLAGGHLTGSVPLSGQTFRTEGNTLDVPMSISVRGRFPSTSLVTKIGVRSDAAVGNAQTAHAAAADLADAFIPTALTGALATATTLAAVPTAGSPATPIALTATVTASGTPVTVGTVQFQDNGVDIGSPAAVGSNGQATLSSTFALGSHPFIAVYSGEDGTAAATRGHQPSTSATVTVPITAVAPKPGPPVITKVSGAPERVTLTYLAAPANGTTITGYLITCTRGKQVVHASTSALSVTVRGLTNNTDYTCSVLAHSSAGDSLSSAPTRARPGTLPKVTLTGPGIVVRGSRITLKGAATAAGQAVSDRQITLTFRPRTGGARTKIGSTKTDKKGHFTFTTVAGSSGAYQATLVLGDSITRNKELFVRVR